MSMSFVPRRAKAVLPIGFGPMDRIGGCTPSQVGHGWTRAAWAVCVGDLIALPILETADGLAVDLEAMADDRPVVLVYDPDLTGRNDAAALRQYAKAQSLVEAADAALIVVTPHRRGLIAAEAEGSTVPLALDLGERFAHTLGLVSSAADEPSLAAATYVLDETHAVVWSGIETTHNGKPGMTALLHALMALRTSKIKKTALVS